MQEQITSADNTSAEPVSIDVNSTAPAEPAVTVPVTPAADPVELAGLLAEAQLRADQAYEQLLYARADLENIQRRHTKELENAHKFALENFARELLQVRDSLELGQAAAGTDTNVDKVREGMELTLKLLSDVMSKFGIARLDPVNQSFNPEYHQAISIQPRADVPASTVVTVIQSGYTLNGRLMRPALVIVSQLPPTDAPQQNT